MRYICISSIRPKHLLIIYLLLSALCLSAIVPVFAADNDDSDKGPGTALNGYFEFTPEEEAFLQAHPKIRMGVMDAWPPINFVDGTGRPNGLGADYIRALNRRLGGIIEIVPGPFAENLEQVKTKALDALMDVTPKPEREEFLNFTRVYLNIPHVIVARRGGPYFASESDLNQKTVALEKGFGNVKYFRENYPAVKIKEFDNTALALDAVSRGQADAYAGNRAVAAWLMVKELISNLEIQGRMNKQGSVLAIGVRKDWPELAAILDKALASIPQEELIGIQKKWFALGFDTDTDSSEITLSEEEKVWIEQREKPVIIGAEMDWPPFDFVEDGRPTGYTNELVRLTAKKLGLPIKFVFGFTWSELLKKFKNGEIDVLPAIYQTPEREKEMALTESYAANPSVLVVHENTSNIKILKDLAGKKLAVVEGFSISNFLLENHPEIQQVPVKNVLEALKAVSLENADAFIGSLGVIAYLLRENVIPHIHIVDEIWLESPEATRLHMATRKDQPILRDILQKGLDAASEAELNELRVEWLGLGLLENRRPKVKLTYAERAWLNQAGSIRISIDPNWPPLESIDPETGEYEGIIAEYLTLISEVTGLGFKLVPTPDFGESVKLVEEGGSDMLTAVDKSGELEAFMDFSQPYLTLSNAVVMRTDAPFTNDVRDLAGRRVGVEIGSSIQRYLEKNYPDLILIPTPGSLEGLRMVADGKIAAYVGTLEVLGFLINTNELFNLKVALPLPVTRELHMAARKGMPPELLTIVNKGIDSITEDDKSAIFRKWISLRVEKKINFAIYWKIGLPVAAAILIIVLVIVWWNRRLTREVKERIVAEQKMQAMSSAIHDALIMIDGRANVMYWNHAAEVLFGIPENEAMGKEMHGLFAPEKYRVNARNGLDLFVKTGRGPVVGKLSELTALRSDGSEFPVEVGVSSFQVGSDWYAVGTVRDITERKQIEEQIKAAREELLLIFDNSQVGIMFMHGDCGLARLNRRLAEILGYDGPKEMIGLSMEHLHLSEKHFNDFRDANKEALQRGEQSQLEYKLKKKDGTSIWCVLAGKAVDSADPPDLSKGVIWVVDDITERKKAQEQLLKSEKEFRAMSSAVHDALIMIDSESNVMFWNPAAERMFGYTADEAMGQNMHELFVTDKDQAAAARGLREFARTGQGPAVGSVLELTALRRDRTPFPVEVVVSPFQIDDKWYAVGTVRDITEKKQAEEMLAESQNRLEMAMTSSNTGLWDWYPLEGRDYHNDQWYRQLGYSREDFAEEDNPLMELMHPDDAIEFKQNMDLFTTSGPDDYQQEFRMKAKDGSWKWILSMGRVQERDDLGQPKRIIGVHLDMTERKNAEEELREHLDELERFNRLVVGRELKMIELKTEVNEMLERSGQGKKYKIVE